jgi:hypothetical protein
LAAVNPPLNANLIRHALVRVCQSGQFRRSPGIQRSLVVVMDAALTGRADEIKEAVIGAGVCRRTPAYDPKADPIVPAGWCFLAESLMPPLPAE